MEGGNAMKFERKLEVGDVIKCKGVKAEIGEILYQDAYFPDYLPEDRHYIDIEFKDTNGKYRHWKSHLDGGEVIYMVDSNIEPNIDKVISHSVLKKLSDVGTKAEVRIIEDTLFGIRGALKLELHFKDCDSLEKFRSLDKKVRPKLYDGLDIEGYRLCNCWFERHYNNYIVFTANLINKCEKWYSLIRVKDTQILGRKMYSLERSVCNDNINRLIVIEDVGNSAIMCEMYKVTGKLSLLSEYVYSDEKAYLGEIFDKDCTHSFQEVLRLLDRIGTNVDVIYFYTGKMGAIANTHKGLLVIGSSGKTALYL